jgi:RRXRR protein/HNH endonuclease
MPCFPRTARLLLRDKLAKVVHATPFTLKLCFGASGYTQEVVASLDTGSRVIGSAAIANGRVVYQAEVKVRNDITGKMGERASYRRTRRSRNMRYRPARFDNRCASRRKGRLPPSIKSKVESHYREVKFIESILPVTRWSFELASFDIHKITNPDVSGVGYQEGALKDFYNVKQFVFHRDGYQCQSGQKVTHSKKLNAHHVVFRSNGGPDTPENLTTLCETCHCALHAGKFALAKGKRSKTKHATEMGFIKSRLSKGPVSHTVAFGYETKYKREQILKWPKTHANDAVATCLVDGELVEPMATILIKTHMASGDYKQTSGAHSQKTVPTGKLFGLRKGDKVQIPAGIGFVKGKRSSGYFSISDLDGRVLHDSEKASKCRRIAARTTTQVECHRLSDLALRRKEKEVQMQIAKHSKSTVTKALPSALSLPALKDGVSRAS